MASISQTVTADEAYVVVIPQRFYGPRGPEPLSMEDRADVIDKLTEIGIASDDIEIVAGRQPYEPVQISVEVAVADLPEIGERILDSVEEVLRRSETAGYVLAYRKRAAMQVWHWPAGMPPLRLTRTQMVWLRQLVWSVVAS